MHKIPRKGQINFHLFLKEILNCGKHFGKTNIKKYFFEKLFLERNKLLFSGQYNFEKTSFTPQWWTNIIYCSLVLNFLFYICLFYFNWIWIINWGTFCSDKKGILKGFPSFFNVSITDFHIQMSILLLDKVFQ